MGLVVGLSPAGYKRVPRPVGRCVVIDAKGLWTHIQQEYKTEKRPAIYIREMMEILVRCCATVFWVSSGHMVCDSLTKLSVKDPGLELLYYVLEQAEVRITYCNHSWKWCVKGEASDAQKEANAVIVKNHVETW